MDSDEFDDDILDEDLIIAATQVPSHPQHNKQSNTALRVQPHIQRPSLPTTGSSIHTWQTVSVLSISSLYLSGRCPASLPLTVVESRQTDALHRLQDRLVSTLHLMSSTWTTFQTMYSQILLM